MFLGTYAPKLDDKGRIILPAKFWDELEAGIVVTRGQERCLYVFSTREFEEHARQDPPGAASPASRPGTTCGCSSPAPTPRCRTSSTA